MSEDQSTEAPLLRLWNPNVAANWSIVFTPIFGAWIHAKNWRELGDFEKAKNSMYWVYGYAIFALVIGFVPDFPAATSIGVTVFWYTSSAKEQINYVKSGSFYEKKSWLKPILLYLTGVVFFVRVITTLQIATIDEDDLKGTSIEILNGMASENGMGTVCSSVSQLEKQVDGSYHAVAEFSDGDKVKIRIKSEMATVSVEIIEDIIEDDLFINTVKGLVNQILSEEKMNAQCESVTELVELESGIYNAMATLSNGDKVKIKIEHSSQQIYVSLIEDEI